MPRYKLIHEPDLEAILVALEDAQAAIRKMLGNAGDLTLPDPIDRQSNDGASPDRPAATERLASRREFRIGRGGYSYADVAEKIMPDGPWSLDEAWERIRGVVLAKGKGPHRSSLIRSLDRDERFKRIDKPDGDIWYRKRTPDQLETLTGEGEE